MKKIATKNVCKSIFFWVDQHVWQQQQIHSFIRDVSHDMILYQIGLPHLLYHRVSDLCLTQPWWVCYPLSQRRIIKFALETQGLSSWSLIQSRVIRYFSLIKFFFLIKSFVRAMPKNTDTFKQWKQLYYMQSYRIIAIIHFHEN